jgi:hypothetical protein
MVPKENKKLSLAERPAPQGGKSLLARFPNAYLRTDLLISQSNIVLH